MENSQLKSERVPAIQDKQEFVPNLCSPKARLVTEIAEEYFIDLWYDKHYHDRHFLGDENGKRDGIDMDVVEKLVLKSMKHIFLYSGHLPSVNFINHKPFNRASRIVLQEEINGVLLNVAIECHFVKIAHYEVTVKTAMRHDEFKMSDNQYVIEIDGDGSILKKFENGKLVDVCKF